MWNCDVHLTLKVFLSFAVRQTSRWGEKGESKARHQPAQEGPSHFKLRLLTAILEEGREVDVISLREALIQLKTWHIWHSYSKS